MDYLSRKEEHVLLTIWKLQSDSYGVTIREQVSETTSQYWSIGAIYDVLDRLTRKGLVNTTVSEPMKERGGKSRRFYKISKAGFAALDEVKAIQESMWSDLPDAAYGEK